MENQRKVIFLMGSTRQKSTSKSIANYLQKQLVSSQIETAIFHAHQAYQNEGEFASLLTHLSQSELLLICAPVYIDGLSYPLTSTLEQLHANKKKETLQRKKLMAIIHSGFPEAEHRKTGINICRHFARRMNFDWQGGLGFGMASVIDGKSLTEMGRMTKWIRLALDETAEAIVNREVVPQTASKKSLKSPIPFPRKWFPPVLNLLTRIRAKVDGISDILACSYSQD